MDITITKSDFRLFREAPRHLWAKKHDRLDESSADELLTIQGEQVETLAREYLEKFILPAQPGDSLIWQETGRDGSFMARADALVRRADGTEVDLYEIKSSTKVEDEDMEDAAFQTLIFQKKYRVAHVCLVLVNNAYVRSGELELQNLLKVEDITDRVNELLPEIESLRGQALLAAQCDDPRSLEHCWAPGDCRCLEVCHPLLPEFSIYDIPRISKDKKRQLEGMGIRAARDIPVSFELSDLQNTVADVARRGSPAVDASRVRAELSKVSYPLYFLDYETCSLAVPLYTGYKPYQHMVFQYSLHRLDRPGSQMTHFEHLSTGSGDPALPLLVSLKANLGETGTVIVWNASFEKSRNKEMGQLYPEYADYLEGLNRRVHDLMEVVSKGLYIHPGFKGSSSIKNVLPVVVPELSYAEMEINNGTKASYGWWKSMFTPISADEKHKIHADLLKYCELDTRAMVEIFQKFSQI